MSKKQRNKKYSPERNYARAARAAVKDIVVIFSLGWEPHFIDVKRRKQVQLTNTLYRAFYSIRHPWRVYTAILLENSQGERYANINDCSPERECYKEDIADILKESQIKQAAKTKKADRVNLGWIASASSMEFDESEIVKLLESFPDLWDRNERGTVLLDEELTIDQQLQHELMKQA